MTTRRRDVVTALAIAAGGWPGLAGLQAQTQPPAIDPAIQKLLAPSGRLRAGLYPGTPTSYLPSVGDGTPRGVGFELGRALAEQLGVPYEPVVFAKNADVLAAVTGGSVDVVFTNASAVRAKTMDFAPAYLQIEMGYLVPASSTLAMLADVDAAGRRIGVTAGSSSQSALTRDLKLATVIPVATVARGVEMLRSGEIDAYATNKATLFEMAGTLPGARVLEGQWGMERHAIAIPKGRDGGRDFLRAFTESAIASGVVQAAVTRAGLKGAIVGN